MESRVFRDELESQITGAIITLAPLFAVSSDELAGFRKPTLLLVDSFAVGNDNLSHGNNLKGRYHFGDCRFEFSRDNLPHLQTVGHEVGHYIHGEINPLFEERLIKLGFQNHTYWAGRELQEFVAELSGIVFASMQGTSSVLKKRGFIYSSEGGLFHVLYDRYSERGYTRADVAFKQYKGSLLPRLARLSVDEGQFIMPREFPISFYEKTVLPLVDKIRKKR